MTAEEIASTIVALQGEQHKNADDALFHDRTKEQRKAAKMRFYHTAGKIEAFRTILKSLGRDA